jgi:hypothetical protein
MKSEVYSWRVAAIKKARLEHVARREGKSLAEVLEEVTDRLLAEHAETTPEYAAEQARIRQRAALAIGSISGGDPTRSSQTSQLVKEILRKKYGR